MKKENVHFNFVIGKQSFNDPFIRVMSMEGNKVINNIYKTDEENIFIALSECLTTLAEYANKKAEEYKMIL